MFILKKKSDTFFDVNNNGKYKYDCIKICSIYFAIGFLWIYFSDRLFYEIFRNKEMLIVASTYKGWLYVVITTTVLYLLINRLLKKINSAEIKLSETNGELEASNEELQAYVEQLTAAEEELRAQYNQLIKNENSLKRAEEKSRKIIEAIPDVLFTISYDGIFIDCQANDNNLLLMPKENFIGKNISEIMPPEITELFNKKRKALLQCEKLQTFEYELMGEHFEIRMVKNSSNEILAILRNVTLERENEFKLKFLSYHDQLTGLYNRRFFEAELHRLDKSQQLPLTIVMGDVNGLKLINDSFGHNMGDELLIKVSEVLKNNFTDDAILTRLGGDEFVILLPGKDSYEAEKMIYSALKSAEKEKVGSINLSISFGYGTKKNVNENIDEIFKSAEDNMYKKKVFESQSMRGKTINTIINTLHEKNKREEAHSHRVSLLCKDIGEALELTEAQIQELKTVGLLHDIGKIAIDENVLNKPGKLNDDEWQQIKRHPEIGYRILNTANDMSEIAKYSLYHHEAWNGTGYPKGLKTTEIPFQSRIINIAGAYDAMTSDRSYRKALPEETAIRELEDKSGIQFDPELVKIFIEKVINKPV